MSTDHKSKGKDLSVVWAVLRSTFGKLKYYYIILGISAVILMLLELLPPMLLKNIVDVNLKSGDVYGTWITAVFYLLASLGSSTFSFIQTYITTYIGQNILIELRLLMANHLKKLPMSYYSKTPVGEIMSRMTSDVESVNTLFSSGLISAFTDLMKVFGIVAAMYFISPVLCLIALAAAPVIFATANYFRKNMFKAQVSIRKVVGGVNTYLQELFNGIRIVKSYGKEEEYKNRFQPHLNEYLNVNNHAAVYDSYFPCVLQVIRAFAIAVILWMGAKTGNFDHLAISIGGLAAFIDLAGRLFNPIEALSLQFQTIQQAMAGLSRIEEFLSEEQEVKGAVQHLSDVTALNMENIRVNVKNVRFGYSKDKTILKDVSLTVESGKKVAIVGRTGAGKTSLINLIAGLYSCWNGEISISGIDPFRLSPADRRKLIGVVPQNTNLFEGTIKDNITLRDDEIRLESVEKAARLVGLDDFIQSLPDKYDTVLGVAGIKLSFGQNQLLSLARAVVTDPPLLLLDEPTSGLDAMTEEMIFKAFRAIGTNRTIITISHRLSGIIDADEVYIMASGKIVQSGSPEKLAGEKGWYNVFRQLEDLGWQYDA
ncbi:MAG: ATP-binding cassette, subfamily multidrug efflux pump [Peptostreptococcaceae bacterium]|nr:ATP-binding cassette, subfamily multidrug efflux pump [Peptostreptococcaceae bacterium]